MRRFESRELEKYAIVLDIFPPPAGRREYAGVRGRVCQLLGCKFFTLLEALGREGVPINVLEKVYIGPGPRDKIVTILRRISFSDLTYEGKAVLERAVETIVRDDEERFVRFFNTCGPITRRMHAFEALPNIGRKTMWQMVRERERRPFESYADIAARVGIDALTVITKKILEELRGEARYVLFVSR